MFVYNVSSLKKPFSFEFFSIFFFLLSLLISIILVLLLLSFQCNRIYSKLIGYCETRIQLNDVVSSSLTLTKTNKQNKNHLIMSGVRLTAVRDINPILWKTLTAFFLSMFFFFFFYIWQAANKYKIELDG